MAATDPRYRFVHREIVLVAMLAGITVAMFLLTRFVAEGDAALRRADAARLYADGLRDLDEGRVEDAVTALGRATARNPQAEPAWLALARALAEGRQEAAAGRVLMRLRDASPEDPDVNLELARLEVRRDDVASAVRFYQSALTALWRQGQAVERGRVRRELIRLLLDHQQPDRAMSEVLVLGVDLPADAASRNELGHLFLRAGSPSRAREQFARALEASPGDPDALAGAGEAAFELGDYARARRDLAATTLESDRVRELRTLAGLVLLNDPLAPGLSRDERWRRLLGNVRQASRRTETCLASERARGGASVDRARATSDDLRGVEASLLSTRGRTTPEAVAAAASVVDRAELAVKDWCGPPAPLDRAILLIGRREGLNPS